MIYHPYSIIGFHSCNKDVGLKVLNGKDDLKSSTNHWDWLGHGIYFWEQNPGRALEYANESFSKQQFNKISIKIPFVLGAHITLGNCLNLVENESLVILKEAYKGLAALISASGQTMPQNRGNNKALDCAVIQYIHESNKREHKQPYDTIRCAFQEGEEVYPGSTVYSRLHIQVCVINPECIKDIFCQSHWVNLILTCRLLKATR